MNFILFYFILFYFILFYFIVRIRYLPFVWHWRIAVKFLCNSNFWYFYSLASRTSWRYVMEKFLQLYSTQLYSAHIHFSVTTVCLSACCLISLSLSLSLSPSFSLSLSLYLSLSVSLSLSRSLRTTLFFYWYLLPCLCCQYLLSFLLRYRLPSFSSLSPYFLTPSFLNILLNHYCFSSTSDNAY